MNIQLDRKKCIKAIVELWILTIGAIVIATAIVSVNLYLHHELSPKRIAFAVFLLGAGCFYGFQLRFYRRLKDRKEAVISYENGILTDYSKPFNKAKNLRISAIFSVDFWGKTKKVNQCRIVLKAANNSPNALLNQLKGNHIYLTDYVIDSADFMKLVEVLKGDLHQTSLSQQSSD